MGFHVAAVHGGLELEDGVVSLGHLAAVAEAAVPFVAVGVPHPGLARIAGARTALSLGCDRGEIGWRRLPGTRISELLPLRRVRACGAGGVAVHQRLARASVLREATRHGLFTMVWTVNEDASMRTFLNHPRVDVLITDRPRRAVALRDEPREPEPVTG